MLEFIHLNSIFQENVKINCLPEIIQEGEIPSTACMLSNATRNKVFYYKDTVKTKYNRTCSCNCVYSKYLNYHHGCFTSR